jgi:hypothetical protein
MIPRSFYFLHKHLSHFFREIALKQRINEFQLRINRFEEFKFEP